jgi:NADH:ubiquinone oxidoreductase subunit 4 (subunit M)
MTRTEVVTLAPLVVLAVGFGIFPGLLLQLWQTPVTEFLARVVPAALALR